jgi:hypothetical protein
VFKPIKIVPNFYIALKNLALFLKRVLQQMLSAKFQNKLFRPQKTLWQILKMKIREASNIILQLRSVNYTWSSVESSWKKYLHCVHCYYNSHPNTTFKVLGQHQLLLQQLHPLQSLRCLQTLIILIIKYIYMFHLLCDLD